ncbi:efflux RND transporter permease subunit [Spirochaeta lutea]|uniref:SSD domain-containing protein n=1 Tax=Spirochaeta lutea TaxID=1480694 RepID=A0A098QWZ0_9SPIO|nr:efflux RND transporter permease subunit [Spirochaeta lutea]KGE71012.1 hypothetical protein DC28_13905 [Spirochaeta lutea]
MNLPNVFPTIQRPLTSIMAFLLLVLISLLAAWGLSVQVFPADSSSQIAIVFSAPGESPAVMADQVVLPFERILNTLSTVEALDSVTYSGYGRSVVRFASRRLLEQALPEIERQLTLFEPGIGSVSGGVQSTEGRGGSFGLGLEKKILRLDGNSRPVLTYSISTNSADIYQLSQAVQDLIIPRLEQHALIAFVTAEGLAKENVALVVDRLELTRQNSNLSLLEDKLQDQILPPATLQFEQQQANLALLYGPGYHAAGLENQEVFELPGEILGSIHRSMTQPSRIISGKSQPGILLRISKRHSADVVDAVKSSQEILNKIQDELSIQGMNITYEEVENSAAFIDESIQLVGQSLVFSLLLTGIVLYFILGSLSYALPVAVTIPSAFLFSLLGFRIFGISLNLLSLAGLILAIGLVVDNGIVVIEAFDRQLRLGRPRRQALSLGLYEVTVPMITSTITTIAALIPLFFLSEQLSSLFTDLSGAIILALLSSLFSSLVILPNMLYATRKRKTFQKRVDWSWFFLERWYQKSIRWLGARRWLPFLILIVVIFLGIVSLLVSPKGFLSQPGSDVQVINFYCPRFYQGDFTDVWVEDLSNELHGIVGDQAQYFLSLNNRFDETVGLPSQSRGWGYVMIVGPGSEISTLTPRLELSLRRADPLMAMDPIIQKKNPIEYLLALESQKNEIRISGYDLEQISLVSNLLRDELNQMGVTPRVSDQGSVPSPGLEITPGPGYDTQAIIEQLLPKVEQYLHVGSIETLDGRSIALVHKDQYRSAQNLFQDIQMAVSRLGLDPYLKVRVVEGPVRLTSERGRYVTRIASTPGIPMAEIAESFSVQQRQTLEQSDVWVEYHSGLSRSVTSARELSLAGVFIILTITLVLLAQFENLRKVGAILLSIPFSMGAAAVAVLLLGVTADVMVMIGLVFIIGICVNDSILLGSSLDQSVNPSQPSYPEDMHSFARRASRRFRPIWMTTLTSLGGILPMVFLSGSLGMLWRPLSLTLLFGLAAATIMSIWILPFGLSSQGGFLDKNKTAGDSSP